jgi:hypothetical protein
MSSTSMILVLIKIRNQHLKGFSLRGDELPQFVVTTPFTCKIDTSKRKINRLFTITCCNFCKYLEILFKNNA